MAAFWFSNSEMMFGISLNVICSRRDAYMHGTHSRAGMRKRRRGETTSYVLWTTDTGSGLLSAF